MVDNGLTLAAPVQAGDFLREAQEMFRDHGKKAPAVAARKALSLIAAGDRDGYLTGLRVLQHVEFLLDKESTSTLT